LAEDRYGLFILNDPERGFNKPAGCRTAVEQIMGKSIQSIVIKPGPQKCRRNITKPIQSLEQHYLQSRGSTENEEKEKTEPQVIHVT